MTHEVIYLSSEYILDWFSDPAHQVEWCSSELADMGDFLPPEKYGVAPVMKVFFEYLGKRGELFTQKEFTDYFWSLYPEFKADLPPEFARAYGARIWRNFYPSGGIDSIHVWALLVESGQFARCLINSEEDVVGKTDLIVYTKKGQRLDLALRIDTNRSRRRAAKKQENLSGMRGVNDAAIDVPLPFDEREKGAGNKRWYNYDDLKPVFDAAGIAYAPKHIDSPKKRPALTHRTLLQAQIFDYMRGAV